MHTVIPDSARLALMLAVLAAAPAALAGPPGRDTLRILHHEAVSLA
jgi:hypothetical protein